MKTLRSRLFCLLLAAASLTMLYGENSFADVKLPGFFTDHMVMQQQKEIVVWGWADASETVTVTLGDAAEKTTADKYGRWRIALPAMTASETPFELKAVGKNEIVVKDVLIGEVWLCSGQSNMEWSVAASFNAKEEIAAGDFPLIRHMKVARSNRTTATEDIKSQWQVCSPETVGNFTACGYYMARELHRELGVPIGLINSSWGGTRVEPWAPLVGFKKVPELSQIYQQAMQKTPGTPAHLQLLDQHISNTEAWVKLAKEKRATDTLPGASPAYPENLKPYANHQQPTVLYNGMIHAIVGYPIRGAIWYQGESNHAEADYAEKKKALIDGWRELWGIGDFPFYYVQIAPYKYGSEDSEILPRFWEQQAAVLEIPNTGMVVVNDIATIGNIHPPNKQDVGRRLSLLALKNDYGKDVIASGPTFRSVEMMDGKLKVTFDHAGSGLKTRDGKTPDWFEIVGDGSGGYHPAEAVIEGDTVVLSSAEVLKPTAVRFAWHKTAEPNLQGGTGLPVSAFRAGEVPTGLSMVPEFDKYQLVYDLDLSKLGAEISYDVDNSASVEEFDRVGYFLELESTQYGNQHVFVSMDAFTEDANKIGVPNAEAVFQQNVTGLFVVTNTGGVSSAVEIKDGNIEFWPHNYEPANRGRVRGASAGEYDFGDGMSDPVEGYGSMQVHNFDAKQTLFSVNHWRMGAKADIGIGNSTGRTKDWTFSANANTYSKKRLRVFVRGK